MPSPGGARLLIIVGSTPEAEERDRPLAYTLRDRINTWLGMRNDSGDDALSPLVMNDLWYVNNAELHERPAIAIGGPEVNAATAWLANRLPTALIIDQRLRVHLDPELIEPKACLWGADDAGTRSAVDVFVERYLDDFLRSALSE